MLTRSLLARGRLLAPEVVVSTAVSTRPIDVSTDRQALRARLAELEAAYRDAAHEQDWAACRRVNGLTPFMGREPLFRALWSLERKLTEGERWWFPNRITNADATFGAKR